MWMMLPLPIYGTLAGKGLKVKLMATHTVTDVEEGIPAQQVPPCQSCHGDKAAGNGPFPRLAGQHRPYLERQLAAFISNARANEIMHANAKDLTALQISQIAAFLSGQQ